jgi:hypothetical protein
VPNLARPCPERQFRDRLGLRQIHRPTLIKMAPVAWLERASLCTTSESLDPPALYGPLIWHI